MLSNESAQDVFSSEYQINSQVPAVKVDNLTTHQLYSFYVVARNSKVHYIVVVSCEYDY